MSKQSTYDLKNILDENKAVSLWRMLTGFHAIYFVAIVCLAFAAVSRAANYYLLQYFVDDVLLQSDFSQILLWVALGFIGLALVQGAFTFLSGRLAAQAAEGIVLRLRNYLYDHLQRLDFTYHDQMQTGELLQRATSDVDALRRLYAEQLVGIGRISMLFLVSLAALLSLNVQLALVSVIVVPVVVGISTYFFRKLEKIFEAYQEQEAAVSTHLQENLTGVRVVKAFARQEYEIARFEEANISMFKRGKTLIRMHGTYWPITDILCGLQMLIGFYVGAQMAINGTITPGAYLAYAGLLVQIIWPIRNLGRLVAHISTGFVSLERVSTIIRHDREPLDEGTYNPERGARGAIRFEDVCFAFEATPTKAEDAPEASTPNAIATEKAPDPILGELVLSNISFGLEPGQIVALMGPAGSGKSSLANLLPRFYDYSSGSITLDGVELRDYTKEYLRAQIGIVQQEPFLFSRSIRENITYGVGRAVTEAEVEAAARAASIHEVILGFPNGYNTLVGERGVTLSGGQKQRITIARTLLQNPKILILDDATSSVDTETEASIREALQLLMEERTTVIIAHRIQSVMHADLILVLDQGRIVQKGTHAELVDQPGTYRQVFALQMRIEDELQQEIDEIVRGVDARQNDDHDQNGGATLVVEQ